MVKYGKTPKFEKISIEIPVNIVTIRYLRFYSHEKRYTSKVR